VYTKQDFKFRFIYHKGHEDHKERHPKTFKILCELCVFVVQKMFSIKYHHEGKIIKKK
jgi:hypothetical protein